MAHILLDPNQRFWVVHLKLMSCCLCIIYGYEHGPQRPAVWPKVFELILKVSQIQNFEKITITVFGKIVIMQGRYQVNSKSAIDLPVKNIRTIIHQ